MKRVKNHLQDVFLAPALSQPVLIPDFGNEVAKNFTLQVADLLRDGETLDYRITSPILYDSMN